MRGLSRAYQKKRKVYSVHHKHSVPHFLTQGGKAESQCLCRDTTNRELIKKLVITVFGSRKAKHEFQNLQQHPVPPDAAPVSSSIKRAADLEV